MILPEYKTNNKWKESDLRMLIKLAGTMSIVDVAKELGKSLKAVKSQCDRRGISFKFNKGNNND